MKKKREVELTVIDAQRAMNLIIVMRKLGNKVITPSCDPLVDIVEV